MKWFYLFVLFIFCVAGLTAVFVLLNPRVFTCSGASSISNKIEKCGYIKSSVDKSLDFYVGYITDLSQKDGVYEITFNMGQPLSTVFVINNSLIGVSEMDMSSQAYSGSQILSLKTKLLNKPVTLGIPAGKNYLSTLDQKTSSAALLDLRAHLSHCDSTYIALRKTWGNRLWFNSCLPRVGNVYLTY